jgi:hypothetical protein
VLVVHHNYGVKHAYRISDIFPQHGKLSWILAFCEGSISHLDDVYGRSRQSLVENINDHVAAATIQSQS